ncbi:hypothetical protein [Allocoleopsis sp.]
MGDRIPIQEDAIALIVDSVNSREVTASYLGSQSIRRIRTVY